MNSGGYSLSMANPELQRYSFHEHRSVHHRISFIPICYCANRTSYLPFGSLGRSLELTADLSALFTYNATQLHRIFLHSRPSCNYFPVIEPSPVHSFVIATRLKMKSTTFISSFLLAGSAVQASVVPPKTKHIDWNYEQKRQILGTLTWLIGKDSITF
jgi:hypothetical protein